MRHGVQHFARRLTATGTHVPYGNDNVLRVQIYSTQRNTVGLQEMKKKSHDVTAHRRLRPVTPDEELV